MTAKTLAQQIQPAAVPFSELEKEYRPMLKLVEQMIGVVPNCDPYLEIWPTGFKTYNLLVPNLLNAPQAILGPGSAEGPGRPGHVRGQPSRRMHVLLGPHLFLRPSPRHLGRRPGR